MKNYIIKKSMAKTDLIKYEVNSGYSFVSNKKSILGEIKSITLYDKDFTENTILKKMQKEYRRLISIIYSIIQNDDSESGDVLIGFTELDRIENLFISKYKKYVDTETLKKYIKKINLLKKELYNYSLNKFNYDYNEESKVAGR